MYFFHCHSAPLYPLPTSVSHFPEYSLKPPYLLMIPVNGGVFQVSVICPRIFSHTQVFLCICIWVYRKPHFCALEAFQEQQGQLWIHMSLAPVIVLGKDIILWSVVCARNGAFLIPLPSFGLPWTSSLSLLSSTTQTSQSPGHLSLNSDTFLDSALIVSLLGYHIHLWSGHPALVCSRPPHSPPSIPSGLPKMQFILFHSPHPQSPAPASSFELWKEILYSYTYGYIFVCISLSMPLSSTGNSIYFCIYSYTSQYRSATLVLYLSQFHVFELRKKGG